ncbi:MAG: YggT family protein [Desulfitobacteriia bacterium]
MVIVILQWSIVIRAFLSWFPHLGQNPVVRIIYELTEPLLKPFRRLRIGGAGAMMDLSPLLALLSLIVIRYLIIDQLYHFLMRHMAF